MNNNNNMFSNNNNHLFPNSNQNFNQMPNFQFSLHPYSHLYQKNEGNKDNNLLFSKIQYQTLEQDDNIRGANNSFDAVLASPWGLNSILQNERRDIGPADSFSNRFFEEDNLFENKFDFLIFFKEIIEIYLKKKKENFNLNKKFYYFI